MESFHHTYVLFERSVPDDGDIKALIGYPLDVMYRELGIEDESVWDFVAAYKEHYRKISREKTILLSNAREAIEEASKFARLGVVTTKTGKYSRELLEHFELMHYFEVLIGREDVQYPKPHPEPIYKAVDYMACDKAFCWMIGDTRLDIKAAQNAGIGCVAVTSGYDTMQQLLTLSDLIEKDALEAVRFIARESRKNTF